MNRSIETHEHSSPIGSWRYFSREANHRLRPFVMRLCGFENVVRPAGGHGIGGPCAELMIGLGGWTQFRPLNDGGREAFRTGRPFVSGLRETSKEYRLEAGFTGVQIDLTVLGAHRLLRAPMDLLANREVEAHEFLGRSVLRLQDALMAEPDWPARFDLVEQYLGRRIEDSSPDREEVVHGWGILVATGGKIQMADLRRRLGISHRRMIDLFQTQLGLPPKRLAELVRFDHALTLATAATDMSLSALAYQAGYYDQPHLTNDFRRRTGLTPAELRRKLVPEASMAGTDALGALFRDR